MDGKFDRRMKPQREREIYRPGSGPLRRTDPAEAKAFVGKHDSLEKLNYSRSGKEDYEAPKSYDNNSLPQNDKIYDRDRRRTRKPDASIYIPKQNRNVDNSECNSYTQSVFVEKPDQKPPVKERFISRDNGRYENQMKPSFKCSRTDVSQWKESVKENDTRKYDNKPYDSRITERNVFSNNVNNEERNNSHHNEPKHGFYPHFDRNERGNGKNHTDRNISRRDGSNSPAIPDMYSSWPPRMQRKFCEKYGITEEEAQNYVKNRNNRGNNNRDDRYSQTLPSKNNRNQYFKTNKNKDIPRSNRVFQKPKIEKTSGSESLPPRHKVDIKVSEERWDTNEVVHLCETSTFEIHVSSKEKESAESSSEEENSKTLFEDTNEVFNWAEEVEREHQNAQRNNSETYDFQKDETNLTDKKRDRKKRRRREFRKKRGFSFERKEVQRNQNISESEHFGRKKDDDHHRTSNDTTHNRTSNDSGNSDGYLSWRRNKAPSPSRTRLGIMPRNYRSDKFDNRGSSGVSDRLNRSKINNKINDLPTVVKEQANSTDKDHVAGILKIPQAQTNQVDVKCAPPVFPVLQQHFPSYPSKPVKQLYNPTNPKQPILVPNQSGRAMIPGTGQPVNPHYPAAPAAVLPAEHAFMPVYMDASVSAIVAPAYMTEQYMMSRPAWYDAYSDSFRSTHYAHLLLDISRADTELQTLLKPGTVVHAWEHIKALRVFLQDSLKTLLTSDLKFCEAENVEQHMWKILFYNIIELLRRCMAEDAINASKYKSFLFSVLKEGTDYFISLLALLERVYKMKIEDFLHVECPSTKTLGYAALALISAQKIYLFLGDLARYKENVEETSNYTIAREWYTKANQLNPRNGRPYNQLAILAVYGKNKFDAVYYYMRSLMASNPFFTARDSLLALFDDNRKKYEQVEKQRRELKEKRKQEKAKEKESVINGSMLRKETWIRPDGGKRIQRTTSTSQECHEESDDDELTSLSAHEVKKRFLLSFLHVHGKLFSKVGMETLIEAAMEMLKEFKMLLNHSPLPISTERLIQLLALNMFAIDNGQLKDPQIESGYHSAVQESALVISLQMFNLIINRCIYLLREQLQRMKNHSDQEDWPFPKIVGPDVQILLPAIKLWCDWLFCHSAVWNPPPSCQDYRISGCGDCWSRLAVLINILEELNYQEILQKIGYKDPILIMSDENNDLIKITLEEDTALRGFTPLMCNAQPASYTHKEVEMDLAQICLRIHRILFFGTMFLCGMDPPVLKLHKTETGLSEYISVVEEVVTPKDQSETENIDEHWSEVEEEIQDDNYETERIHKDSISSNTEEKGLLYRKKELERIHQKREKYMRDNKETIKNDVAAFSVEMEIKPHYLVPDTNCFIDCLAELEKIAKAVSSMQRPLYSLMVPVVVLSELEGIARGAQKDEKVTEKARYALNFLQNQRMYSNIKCVTTRGSVLSSTRCTNEEDYSKVEKNDDKILTTCLNLCKHNSSNDSTTEQPKKIYREVVLLTEDRNLRVKALSSNMPVQTVSDFVTWAALK